MLKPRLVLYILPLLLLLCSVNSRAQKTLINEENIRFYNKGLELLSHEKYGSALDQFNIFINATPDYTLKADATYYVAFSSMELGQPSAEDLFLRFLSDYPESPKANLAVFQLGKYYYRSKKYRKAIENLEKVNIMNLSTDDVIEYHFAIGYSYFQENEYEKAKPSLAVAKDVKNKFYFPANYYYGYIAYKNGEYEEALSSFEKVKESKNYAPIIPLYISKIYYAQRKYQQVIEYADTINNAKYADEVNAVVAKSHYQLAQYEKALPRLVKMSSSGYGSSDADIYMLGYTYYQTGNYEKAITEFTKIAFNKDTTAQNSGYHMADAFLKLNKKQNARNAFLEASKLPYDRSIRELSLFNYARLSYELSFHNEAIRAVQEFLSLFPRSTMADEAKAMLGQIFLTTRNYREAVPILESIKDMTPEIKGVYQKIAYYRAEELLLNKDVDSARIYLIKSLTYPQDKKIQGQSYYWLGEINYRTGRFDEAAKNFNSFLAREDSKQSLYYFTAYYNLGYSWFSQKNYKNALLNFKRYLELDSYFKSPELYIDATMRAGDCNYVLKNYEAALDAYDYVISKNGEGTDYAFFQKATILGLQGKNSEKIAALKNIKKGSGSDYEDDAQFGIGETYMKNKQYNEAIAEFNKFISAFPSSNLVKKAYMNIGQCYYNMNSYNEAVTTFTLVRNKYPNTAEAIAATLRIKSIYTEINKVDELFALLGNEIAVGEKDSIAYESALDFYNEGNCEESSRKFGKYIEDFPRGFYTLQAHYYKADCEYKAKKYDAALPGYEYVLSAGNSEFMEVSTRQAATIYYLKKNYEKALPLYKQLEKLAQSRDYLMQSYVGQMRSAYFLNDQSTAKQYAQKLLTFDKVTKDALIEANLTLGRIELAEGRTDAAATAFKAVVKDSKSIMGAEAKYNLAYIQFLKSDYKASQKTIFELKDQFSAYDYWLAKAFILLADNYIKLNDAFQAKHTLQSVIDNYEGAELKTLAQEKLKAITDAEAVEKEKTKKAPQKNEDKDDDE